MTSSDKPYRRFRAHGREEIEPDTALDAIRELRRRDDDAHREHERSADAARPPRAPRRPAPAGPSRWWSLRGRTRGQIARRALAVIGLVVLVWGIAGFLAVNGAAKAANKHVSSTARRALSDPGGGLMGTAQNILVIGSDSRRGGSGGRADTILIMRTDPDAGKLNYLSLPRDLRVAWGSTGDHIKLGETYSHRGITGLIGAIRAEIGVPIHHVMVVDFSSLSHMVNAVGGIEVNNPFDLRDCPYPGGKTVTFPKGKITLDGARALEYSRVRKCDGDIQRAERQQLVVGALKSKVLSFGSLPVAPFRGARIIRSLATDMGTLDLAKFGWLQAKLDPGTKQVLATEGALIGGVSYQLLEPALAGPQIRSFGG